MDLSEFWATCTPNPHPFKKQSAGILQSTRAHGRHFCDVDILPGLRLSLQTSFVIYTLRAWMVG